jgi:hypothetical protein
MYEVFKSTSYRIGYGISNPSNEDMDAGREKADIHLQFVGYGRYAPSQGLIVGDDCVNGYASFIPG